jgi:hypothetical protein
MDCAGMKMPLLCFGNAISNTLQALLDAHPGIDLYLFEREGKFNIMGESAVYESPGLLQVLLDFKADVNSQDRARGLTPLNAAAAYGRVECKRLLLEKDKQDSHWLCGKGSLIV